MEHNFKVQRRNNIYPVYVKARNENEAKKIAREIWSIKRFIGTIRRMSDLEALAIHSDSWE